MIARRTKSLVTIQAQRLLLRCPHIPHSRLAAPFETARVQFDMKNGSRGRRVSNPVFTLQGSQLLSRMQNEDWSLFRVCATRSDVVVGPLPPYTLHPFFLPTRFFAGGKPRHCQVLIPTEGRANEKSSPRYMYDRWGKVELDFGSLEGFQANSAVRNNSVTPHNSGVHSSLWKASRGSKGSGQPTPKGW